MNDTCAHVRFDDLVLDFENVYTGKARPCLFCFLVCIALPKQTQNKKFVAVLT